MVYTISEAINRFQAGRKLPIKGSYVLNGLILVEKDPELVGTVAGGCKPLLLTKKVLVPVSLEPIADIPNKMYFDQEADPRQYDLSGNYFGSRSKLPVELFNSSLKRVFYANIDLGSTHSWVSFDSDVQSLGSPSISYSSELGVPLALRGYVQTQAIDLIAELEELLDGEDETSQSS